MKETQVNELKGHRRFDETLKRHAVELSLRTERTVKAVAEELGISPHRLYALHGGCFTGPSRRVWSRPSPTGRSSRSRRIIGRLRAEVLRLREREIVLKKSLGILSETPESGMPGSKR